MELNFILKIIGIGLIVAVIGQVMNKTGRDEYSVLISVSGLVVIVIMLLPKIGTLINDFKSMFNL